MPLEINPRPQHGKRIARYLVPLGAGMVLMGFFTQSTVAMVYGVAILFVAWFIT